jgi:hypothetical protein
MDFGSIFWLFFIVTMLLPIFKQRALESSRIKIMRDLEKKGVHG